MATVAELTTMMQNLNSKVNELMQAGGNSCSAEYPHTGQLQYSGGTYLCRCGQRYSKDGHGGLREE